MTHVPSSISKLLEQLSSDPGMRLFALRVDAQDERGKVLSAWEIVPQGEGFRVAAKDLPVDEAFLVALVKMLERMDSDTKASLDAPHSSARRLLKHAGTWIGDDLQDRLDDVYATRGKARF